MQGPGPLTPEYVLLTTLLAKIAVMATLATMLVRYRRFRHILIFERRAWPDRLVFALSFGVPLAAGVWARLLLHYDAADLTMEGSFLAGLIAGPYAGATVGGMLGFAPLFVGEWAALPFAVGCGFAGGGIREVCPKEAIWHFSPFIFTSLPRRAWRMIRTLQTDWQVVLLLAPISLELLGQALGFRWIDHRRLFVLSPSPPWSWTMLLVLLTTVLCVATPIKIWNNARIEHRLQEQEKLLLTAKIDALSNQINPHFLFNTLASISSLIRTQPDTARMLITKLSGMLRRLMRSSDHFVTLREELEALRSSMGVTDSIHFLGYRKDIPDLIAASRCIVHTSDTEGLPNAVMEAMASGRAVVATDVGDVSRLIEDGKTGFVVPVSDFEALLSRIIEMITDVNIAERLGLAAREFARRNFALSRLVEETFQLQLDRLRIAIADGTKAIANLEEEARRANVPAGWLR
jgi:glycosyltransferase involved in cell wall biosynthesis